MTRRAILETYVREKLLCFVVWFVYYQHNLALGVRAVNLDVSFGYTLRFHGAVQPASCYHECLHTSKSFYQFSNSSRNASAVVQCG